MSVWDCFIRNTIHTGPYPGGSNPFFLRYICKVCGTAFDLQMGGSQSIRERSFEDQAFFKLADHLAEHVFYEGKVSKAYIKGRIQEKIELKRFIMKAVDVRICPKCGSDITLQGAHEERWICTNKECDFSISSLEV